MPSVSYDFEIQIIHKNFHKTEEKSDNRHCHDFKTKILNVIDPLFYEIATKLATAKNTNVVRIEV